MVICVFHMIHSLKAVNVSPEKKQKPETHCLQMMWLCLFDFQPALWEEITNLNRLCVFLVSPAGTCPMSSPVWCVMAPVLSGVWWGPEAGVVGSGAATATGVASWLGSGQLVVVVTLSTLTVLLLVSMLLLLCASCQGWALHHTHAHI